MKNYEVQVPFAGIMAFSVEAKDEDEAKEKALGSSFEMGSVTGDNGAEMLQFDMYEQICQGNVLYVPLNEVEVQED